MSLRLLGGEARGFLLQAPPEKITRPTAALLKRRLFDWRQDWSERCFVDLCAGSGGVGLEALSRGARALWLNESHRDAYRVLEKNVRRWSDQGHGERLGVPRLQHGDFRRLLGELAKSAQWCHSECTLFFDPPYEEHALYQQFFELVRGLPCELIIEGDTQKGPPLSELRQHLSGAVKEFAQSTHWLLVARPLPR